MEKKILHLYDVYASALTNIIFGALSFKSFSSLSNFQNKILKDT